MADDIHRYVDRVIDASMQSAQPAIAATWRAVEAAIESADNYEAAGKALARLEQPGARRAALLRDVLEGAIRNGTSAGGASVSE